VRIEKDSMGEMEVPEEALYGASTQRAVLNFEVSSYRFSRSFISALGLIKHAASVANRGLNLLDKRVSEAICQAAKEVMDGKLYNQFVVDLFQTGSGTSTNMNANEVIANRAVEILGGEKGDKNLVHPNDHVNMCQSSNDVIPSCINISVALELSTKLMKALSRLHESLQKKSNEFSSVIKSGRTHLQDATPITLGQEFSGYAAQVESGIARVQAAKKVALELALGGTAVGTGLNAHPDFARIAISEINRITGEDFFEAKNHFEAQASQDTSVEISGQLKAVAISLMKIANDLRWLAAGPRCSIAELRMPAIQPGSSIMPGKVNPVTCESLLQVGAKVIGNDACINTAALQGNFELNTMLPVIAFSLLESIDLLSNVSEDFRSKCIDGVRADNARCLDYAENSLSVCTSLVPVLGYDQVAEIAKKALNENKSIRQVIEESGLMKGGRLKDALDLFAMTRPGLR